MVINANMLSVTAKVCKNKNCFIIKSWDVFLISRAKFVWWYNVSKK